MRRTENKDYYDHDYSWMEGVGNARRLSAICASNWMMERLSIHVRILSILLFISFVCWCGNWETISSEESFDIASWEMENSAGSGKYLLLLLLLLPLPFVSIHSHLSLAISSPASLHSSELLF